MKSEEWRCQWVMSFHFCFFSLSILGVVLFCWHCNWFCQEQLNWWQFPATTCFILWHSDGGHTKWKCKQWEWTITKNANASNMIEAMLRRLIMRITWCQYPILMTSSSSACFESPKPCTKSFVLLFRLIHFKKMKEFDCCGRETIGLDVKIMMALKVNAYGVAANAFDNYYQNGWINSKNMLLVLKHFLIVVNSHMFIFARWQSMMQKDCQTTHQKTWSCWIAWCTGLYICYLEKLPHCIARCFNWERRLSHNCAWGDGRLQPVNMACCLVLDLQVT